jgi:hypothetical protein
MQPTALAVRAATANHRASPGLRLHAQAVAAVAATALAVQAVQAAVVTAAAETQTAAMPRPQVQVAAVHRGKQEHLAYLLAAAARQALLLSAPMSQRLPRRVHHPHQQAAGGIFINLPLAAA